MLVWQESMGLSECEKAYNRASVAKKHGITRCEKAYNRASVAKKHGITRCEKAYNRASVARMPKKAAKARTRNIMREFSILINILKYTRTLRRQINIS
jgi:hypothetical protein